MEKGGKDVEKWETEKDSDPVDVFFLFKIKCPGRMANKVRLKRQRPGETREHGDFGCEKSVGMIFFRSRANRLFEFNGQKSPQSC